MGSSLLLLEWPPRLPQALPQTGWNPGSVVLSSASIGVSMSFPKTAISSPEAAWLDHPTWGQGMGCVDPFGLLRSPFDDRDISQGPPPLANLISTTPGTLSLTLSTSSFSVPAAQTPT